MRERFTNAIVNIQQAVMLNIDKISDVSVKVYDLNKMLRRTDYAVGHNTDAIETLESSVEEIESRLSYDNGLLSAQIHADIKDVKQEAHHTKLANAEEFNKLFNRVDRNEEKLETSINKLLNRMSAIEKALEKLGAYDEQDLNNPAAVEMDRLDEELSKFIVDEFNK